MKKFIFIALALLCMFCTNRETRPENLLSEEKMRDILIQIHLAEAKVSYLNMPEDSSKSYFNTLSKKIYHNFGTDSATFKKSFNYYSNEASPVLEKIYASVVDSLSMRESRKMLN